MFIQLLEIGCGNGKLWEYNSYNLRNREIFLSDISEGMLEDTRKKLGNEYNYIVLDGQNIPFKNCFFDIGYCKSRFILSSRFESWSIRNFSCS